jgi:hypothetical protein
VLQNTVLISVLPIFQLAPRSGLLSVSGVLAFLLGQRPFHGY